jgi:putative transposase
MMKTVRSFLTSFYYPPTYLMSLFYVLMKNHFHLLLSTPEANLPDFMRHFNISYTAVYNRRHGRIGHLYQGRYKAYLVEADSYLLELSRYIYLNPVRIKGTAKKSPKERWSSLVKYRWSSFEGYLHIGKRKPFVNHEVVLEYLGGDNRKGRSEYRKFVRWGWTKTRKVLWR